MATRAVDFIVPSRYISFTLPSPSFPELDFFLHTDRIRIAILDSHLRQRSGPPAVAAMVVPRYREADWIFNTQAGHSQLLTGSPSISRLILIGNDPSGQEFGTRMYTRPAGDNHEYFEKLEDSLYDFLIGFLPKRNRELENFEITFLRYEDNVVNAVVLERLAGPMVGPMLVEDIEIDCPGPEREFRRRLRFKRMPNLVQSEIRIVPEGNSISSLDSLLSLRDLKFQPDLKALVHVYLAPMVASLALISSHIQDCFDFLTVPPRALCLGVGGGALMSFLATQLGFDVVGVELDLWVCRAATQYFGLEQCKSVRVFVGDGIQFLKDMAGNTNRRDPHGVDSYDLTGSLFDVIMVDLDPSDFRTDTGAPPVDFIQNDVFLAAKACLCGTGLLVMNVIPPRLMDYMYLARRLKEVFAELYLIDTGNEENFVLIATMSTIQNFGLPAGVHDNAFSRKLRSVTPGAFMDKIRKL